MTIISAGELLFKFYGVISAHAGKIFYFQVFLIPYL